ncbi:MAG: hypothetical protein M3198_13375 [Actinomycetota bacterium]|nr:hypothetical protein [Actinomycetota bacterium]
MRVSAVVFALVAVAFGLVVGRWWAALVALIPVALSTPSALELPDDSEPLGGLNPLEFLAFGWLTLAGLITAGVAVHKLARLLWHGRGLLDWKVVLAFPLSLLVGGLLYSTSDEPVPPLDKLEVATGRVTRVDENCSGGGNRAPVCRYEIVLEGGAGEFSYPYDSDVDRGDPRSLQSGGPIEIWHIPGDNYAWQIRQDGRFVATYDSVVENGWKATSNGLMARLAVLICIAGLVVAVRELRWARLAPSRTARRLGRTWERLHSSLAERNGVPALVGSLIPCLALFFFLYGPGEIAAGLAAIGVLVAVISTWLAQP